MSILLGPELTTTCPAIFFKAGDYFIANKKNYFSLQEHCKIQNNAGTCSRGGDVGLRLNVGKAFDIPSTLFNEKLPFLRNVDM